MSSLSHAASSAEKRTNARYWIVVMLFIVTSFNYGDRATLSIAGSEMAKDIGLDPVGMGYVFSAFSWAYVIGQIPGGWLLDRFGSKRVYFWSIFIWSAFTLLQGFVDIFSGFGIIVALFTLRFLVGLAEAPSFPGNSRIVAAWFPAQERGTAVAIFNSAQYFATVIFAPIMGWLTHEVGWSHVFFFMGGLGIVISFIWLKVIHEPNLHPGVNKKELEYIAEGGALINMDQKSSTAKVPFSQKWAQIRQLVGSRMMIGIYLGQYCINALTYFFITWFPVYLVQARGMSILKAGFVASVPAICGFVGGVLGGVLAHGRDEDVQMVIVHDLEEGRLLVGVHAQAGPPHGPLGLFLLRDGDPVQRTGGLSEFDDCPGVALDEPGGGVQHDVGEAPTVDMDEFGDIELGQS